MIDQVHVVHAGRTGGHAGQAGQAAVDVPHHLLGGGTAGLQHVLDQVDAAARAVEFVAEQQEGRAGGGAEAAMHAGAQHLVGRGGVRIAQLLRGEIGLHRFSTARWRHASRNRYEALRQPESTPAPEHATTTVPGRQDRTARIDRIAEEQRTSSATIISEAAGSADAASGSIRKYCKHDQQESGQEQQDR